eukprot:3832965-Rhodomonas_salina.1
METFRSTKTESRPRGVTRAWSKAQSEQNTSRYTRSTKALPARPAKSNAGAHSTGTNACRGQQTRSVEGSPAGGGEGTFEDLREFASLAGGEERRRAHREEGEREERKKTKGGEKEEIEEERREREIGEEGEKRSERARERRKKGDERGRGGYID